MWGLSGIRHYTAVIAGAEAIFPTDIENLDLSAKRARYE